MADPLFSWWNAREHVTENQWFGPKWNLLAFAALAAASYGLYEATTRNVALTDSAGSLLRIALFLLLFCELYLLFGSALQYLLTEIFCPVEVRLHNRLQLNKRSRDILAGCLDRKRSDDADVDKLAASLMDPRTLATEALRGLAMFGYLGGRLLASFTTASLGLIWIGHLLEKSPDVFAKIGYSEHALGLVGKVAYLTLVTVSTVGYGDMAPSEHSSAGMLLGFVEILSSSVFLLFVINLCVGWVFQLPGTSDGDSIRTATRTLVEEEHGKRRLLRSAGVAQASKETRDVTSIRAEDGLTIGDSTVAYGENVILNRFSQSFPDDKIYVLMGRNGCGKSTLLKAIVGYVPISTGEVTYIRGGQPEIPAFEYMPQNYRQAVFPWKTVRKNARPWDSESVPSFEQDAPLQHAMAGLELTSLDTAYPYELSGGQQQKSVLCRCAVSRAGVLLLDEPLSAIDVVTRPSISETLREIWKSEKKLVIAAMHEPDEAVQIADVVMVFHGPPLRLVATIDRSRHEDQDGRADMNSFRSAVASCLAEHL